jgi:GntR family transcriptional regulator, transcriptional repressor for pyruvate dehydrogenase complex
VDHGMFKSVRPDRISQAIVDQIKEAIFKKKIKIGDKLPSERQMIEQFETSRVTVREALKSLENSGILEIRRGTQGGAFVRDPDVKFVSSFLQDMFSMGNIRVFDLTEARIAVEPFSVKMATERIREDSLEQIRQNIRETRECLKSNNAADARLLTLEYHRLIAQASGNPVIFFMVDSIMDIMENNVSTIIIPAESVKNTLRDHEEICDAVIRRDPEMAQALMLKHIQEIHAALDLGRSGKKNAKKSNRQSST